MEGKLIYPEVADLIVASIHAQVGERTAVELLEYMSVTEIFYQMIDNGKIIDHGNGTYDIDEKKNT